MSFFDLLQYALQLKNEHALIYFFWLEPLRAPGYALILEKELQDQKDSKTDHEQKATTRTRTPIVRNLLSPSKPSTSLFPVKSVLSQLLELLRSLALSSAHQEKADVVVVVKAVVVDVDVEDTVEMKLVCNHRPPRYWEKKDV